MTTLERASRSARQMYPEATSIAVKCNGPYATVLVNTRGRIRVVRYSNLDAIWEVKTLSPIG